MGDEYKDKMIEHLMKMYRDKTEDWVFGEVDEEIEDDEEFWDEVEDEEEDDPYDPGSKFSKIAATLMDELTENNLDSHILLKYPKIADWWGSVLKDRAKKAEAQRKREEARRKKEEDARARESLLARLTPEERRLLGVK